MSSIRVLPREGSRTRPWHGADPEPAGRIESTLDALARATIETDRQYFELAATIEAVEGAELAWMPGVTMSPSGVVVHRVDADLFAAGGRRGLHDVEVRLRELHAPVARVYLDGPATAADEILTGAGYSPRRELTLVGVDLALPDDDSRLTVVAGDDGWDRKARFHAEAGERPDGYLSTTDEWVAMERAKCETGFMEAFLLEVDGMAVGAVCAQRHGDVLRGKNFVTHSRMRRRGLGRALISHVAAVARDEGRWVTGFAVAGSAAERLYRSAGFQVAGYQVEWSKPLG